MNLNGFWSLKYLINNTIVSAGVLTVNDNKITGGDTWALIVGEVTDSNNVEFSLSTHHHDGGMLLLPEGTYILAGDKISYINSNVVEFAVSDELVIQMNRIQ